MCEVSIIICFTRISLFHGSYIATENLKLQEQTESEEDGITEEHSESHGFVHPPTERSDHDDDQHQHDEKEKNGAEHSLAVHYVWFALNQAIQNPRQWQSEM